MDLLQEAWEKINEHSSIVFIGGFASLYAVYYLTCVVKKPLIVGGESQFNKFLHKHCSLTEEYFWPTWWCFESRFQTVLRFLLQGSPVVHYESELIKLPDGGEIQLDWECSNDNNENGLYPPESRPIVVLLPGLTGTSRESYMLNMVHDASALGYRCVVFMNRGVGDAELKTPRTYCAANVEDLEFVLEYIKKQYPSAPMVAVGISMGGMMVFNYLAKKGDASQLDAAMVISVGWNVFAAVDSLDNTLNYYLFNRTLARGLCNLVRKNLKMFESFLDIPHVLKSKTIKDFDERFTTKIFGYNTVEDYYKEASPDYKISRVTKPVLCLSAADDPFCPRHAIPIKNATESKNVVIVVTSYGGHIGFLEGMLPRRHNYMNRWFVQYIKAIFQHAKKEL